MSLDFATVRQRLADAERRLGGELDDTEARRILEQRAARLAARDRDQAVEERGERIADTVVVRRHATALGLPVDAVATIQNVAVSALPHATDVLVGLFQIRGRIHCLADPAPLFAGRPARRPRATPNTERRLVALITPPVVDEALGPLGLVLDEVVGPRSFYEGDLGGELDRHRAPFVTAVSRDLVHLVDIVALLRHPEVSGLGLGATSEGPHSPRR